VESQDDEIARLRKRLRDDPRSLAFVPLAELLRKAGRGGEALLTIRVGLRQHPEHAAARVVLARLHLDAGARALAVSVLEEVAEHDHENLAAGTLLAELWVDEGRLREARALIDRLAHRNPGDSNLSGLMRRANPPPRPLHGDPSDPFDCESWAERCARRGDYAHAKAAWRRICAFNPADPRARDRLAELERAAQGRGDAVGEAERGAGEGAPLPGLASTCAALADEVSDTPRPRGAPGWAWSRAW